MPEVNKGRWMAQIDGDFVVFIIGARPQWHHLVRALRDLGGRHGMPYLLKKLSEDPEKGLLGYEQYGLGTVVQYWRSFEHLERFANDTTDPHVAIWRSYWKRVGTSSRTGIWHETYLVRAGEYEAIYGNMPPHGLGKAASVVPMAEALRARDRLHKRVRG